MKLVDRPDRLFDRVAGQLRKFLISEVSPGGKLPALHELSATLGVSPTTLRTAQALLVQEGWLDVRHGSGVYATSRVQRRVIGIVSEMDLLHPRATPFVSEAARLLRDALTERGLRTELYVGTVVPWSDSVAPTCLRFFEDFNAGRLDGVVVVNAPRNEPWQHLEKDESFPWVSVAYDVLTPDAKQLVELGVRQLQEQGCRRVAMLGWGGASLQKVLRDAAHASGVEVRDKWMRTDFHPWLTAAGWAEFREAWSAYTKKPDGLLILDDGLFSEAVVAIDELRIRVPDQMRVVTHANKGAGVRYTFPVTLLQNDPALVAKILETKLLKAMKGEPRGEPTGHALEIVQIGGKASGVRILQTLTDVERKA